MRIEDRIAGMCLSGFICKEPRREQLKCLDEIELKYGKKMAGIVKRLLSKR